MTEEMVPNQRPDGLPPVEPLRAGRRTICTPELKNELIQSLLAGCTEKDAYVLAGIGHDTFYEWKRNKEFAEDIEKAKTAFKKTCIRTVVEAGKKNWQAHAWMLERRFKQEYSQTFETSPQQPIIQLVLPKREPAPEIIDARPDSGDAPPVGSETISG